MFITRRRVLAALGTAGLAGCLSGDGETESDDASVETEALLTGLDTPWDLAFGEGGIYLSERPGRVSLLEEGERETVVESDATENGEGGMLGIALDPAEEFLYAYYTRGSENRVVRYALDAPGDPEPIVEGIPAAGRHNGGRIDFGPEGDLWVLTGDADDPDLAQDPESLAGSVLRLTPEGEPATDTDLPDPRIYTYGHRNPQGIAWLPDGTPMITEHGPNARDEVSRLVAGANYGWPAARDGGEYPDTEFARPLVNTGPDTTWAPSGMTYYAGNGVENWRDRLLIGGLRSQQVIVLALTAPGEESPEGTTYDAEWLDDAYTATATAALPRAIGRVRHVAAGPDALYAITSNRDGRAYGRFPREEDDVLVRLST
ncbi:sorbosone dehydrogenase family protein [Halalkalicoccus sp. NIPERK01]|uniref:PQQ-dependent sugar dehydrogenase n=1 Tax=Halalkalicoccus sp. NIPERK01 TaxID=3053469 RepID=UPI00256EAF64|nr:PQQ-dependent sugar dehydrogenase [Halalkalicoccus sp. NIPERK01]MDL5360383.1 PQQ-dependent sugar dehydrogenase [Halalkalicoccus sp. NIPERK01]